MASNLREYNLRNSSKRLIRLLSCKFTQFYLADEVQSTIECMIEKGVPKEESFMESEEEGRLGIVYTIDQSGFDALLEKYEIDHQDFDFFHIQFSEGFRDITFPLISYQGIPCLLAIDAFLKIIYYLAVTLKVFQRSKDENLEKVFDWIESLIDTLFIEKPVLYLIEVWKVDEIIDQARVVLRSFLTESKYEIPLQTVYSKGQMEGHLERLTKNLEQKAERPWFFFSTIENICDRTPDPITIKDVYSGYFEIIQKYLIKFHPKVQGFIDNQSRNSPKNEPHSESEENKLLKENGDSMKKQESEQEAEIEEKSIQYMLQQLGEEVENLKIENQQLREDQEKSEKTEDNLRLQMHLLTVSFEAKYQKKEEELKKSQNAEAELVENLKIQEQNHLEDIGNLKKDSFKVDIEMVLLKAKLKRETAENMNLKQKNEELQAENSKNTEFQQNIKKHSKTLEKEHCDLVDIARSRLDRLCSKYPDIEEAKNDVMKMEDCVDEYVENVKKEYKKLQE